MLNINTILMLVSVLVFVALITILYLKNKNEKADIQLEDKLDFDALVDRVKYSLSELVKEESNFGLTDEEWNAWYNRKARFQGAMRDCIYGMEKPKEIVKDLIRSTISQILPNEEDVLQIIDFKAKYLDTRIKFEILMYFYKNRYQKLALSTLIEKYDLGRVRYDIEDGNTPSYLVTTEDIDTIYNRENFEMTRDQMLDVLTVLVFQKYKGFGIIDTIREMDINGINCGTSGSILTYMMKRDRKITPATRSVWIYYSGKYIHFKFLNFNSEEELRRVIQLIIKHGNPGPLTEKRGYAVTTMYDKSRVLAIRPPVGEYWGVFIRKFFLPNVDPEFLLNPQNAKYKVVNAQLIIGLLRWLMLAQVTTAFTGRQSSGKTTMMTGAVRYIDARYNLRILEMTPEMFLREIYSDRNIFSVSETDFVSAEALQDALKKSDGGVSVIGEVATDIVAARMIQMAQVGSLFTMFSHHATTTKRLVLSIRNSLVNAGGYSNQLTAEQQTVEVLSVDIHHNFTPDGERYIERVTEIIQLEEGVPYPEYNPKDPINSMNRIQAEYYRRKTDRQTFVTRDILKYDLHTHTYYTCEWFTSELTAKMLQVLPPDKTDEFKDWVKTNWSSYFKKHSKDVA